jgi:hypothetical protein
MKAVKNNICFVFVVALLCLCYGCRSDDKATINLNGMWIDAAKQDTLIFNEREDNTFTVKRGYEFVNGYRLPKIGTDIYSYKWRNDSILINGYLWNCICFPAFYFSLNSDNTILEVGDFYNPNYPTGNRLKFYKVKYN